MKIATWNVNSLKARLEHVLTWLEHTKPDVLAIQETKTRDENFPADAFAPLAYRAAFRGQPAYNGVALLTRVEPADLVDSLDGLADEQKRVLAATIGPVRVWNLYVPNGQSVDSEKFRYKLEWLAALTRQLERELQRYPHLAVVGDFNVAPEDRDVHDPDAWRDQVLCSRPERAALRALLDLGLRDVFRQFEQPENSFSWWDYRQAAFRRNLGLRIDLVLASPALSERCLRSAIDVEPRRWPRPSDHTPVVAEFALD